MAAKVVVIKQFISEDSPDLEIVMIATIGEWRSVSPIMTIKGVAANHDGNPYLVFGAACEKFTGIKCSELSIAVASITVGDLSGISDG